MRRLATLLIAAAACGGGGNTEDEQAGPTSPGTPTPRQGISIEAGANVSDTIGAALPVRLRVTLRDTLGAPAVNRQVAFRGTASGSLFGSTMLLDVPGYGLSPNVVMRTAADGSAEVVAVMGNLAGAAGIEIDPYDAPYASDTARFTVLPGRAASIRSFPEDTAVAPGASFTILSRVEDRMRNPRTDEVSYAAINAQLSLSAARLVTAVSVGRTGVIATAAGVAPDTAWMSIVPAGTIAVRVGSSIRVMRLDGSPVGDLAAGTHASAPLEVPNPEWAPDGQSLYSTLGAVGSPAVVYRLELGGTRSVVVTCTFSTSACPPAGSGVALNGFPHSYMPSADGRFFYLSAGDCNYQGILYQVQLQAPVSVRRLSPANTNDCFGTIHRWPSISPDGAVLAFENDSGYFAGHTWQLMDVAVGSIRELRLAGRRPRWSPLGDQIAFVHAGRVWLTRPDGTDLRALTPTTPTSRVFLPGVTWSPDARWLLAQAQVSGRSMMILIEVATGTEYFLPFSKGWEGELVAVWRPGT